MSDNLRDKIIEEIERLGEPQRQQMLDFARRLASPAGTPGRNLLYFVGSIDAEDLRAMSQAIQEDCEKVDPNAW